MDVNSSHKDSVFTALFSDKKRLLELYNAIEGTHYGDASRIELNTLQNVLFMDRLNDISFTLDGRLVVLIEHQSTINANMPLRFLLYIARVYEKLIQPKTIYRENLQKIPKPEFIVLYNGTAPYPDRHTQKLSDAFIELGIDEIPVLELTVQVLNINKGRNEQIVKKSRSLDGYATFIALIRENRNTMDMEGAVTEAIKQCIHENILGDFLKTHSTEVINMLFTEWNWDDAKAVWQEEAREDGLEKGFEKGRKKRDGELLALIEKGYSVDQLRGVLTLQEAEPEYE
jgi:hypothetical protein